MLFQISQELMFLCPIVTRAGGKVAVATDGVTVDHTPPEMIEIGTENRTQYQQRDDVLNFAWDFQDPESGVGEYRCVVFQTFHVSCLLLVLLCVVLFVWRCRIQLFPCRCTAGISCLLSFLSGVAGYCCVPVQIYL